MPFRDHDFIDLKESARPHRRRCPLYLHGCVKNNRQCHTPQTKSDKMTHLKQKEIYIISNFIKKIRLL